MMMFRHVDCFHIIGPLWGDSTNHWWIPSHKDRVMQDFETYRKTSNISRTLMGNKIVDQSDVVGAAPVGAAPTTSSFST